MKRAVIACSVAALALASCVSIDATISKVNADVRNYCDFLTIASGTATEVSDREVLRKIDAALSSYCEPGTEIKDIPGALVALAKIYKVTMEAKDNGKLSVAAN